MRFAAATLIVLVGAVAYAFWTDPDPLFVFVLPPVLLLILVVVAAALAMERVIDSDE